SVAINSDVELGGTDQKFNLLVGRDIQRENGMEPQCILTMPLLVGTDGTEKMSKSYGNYIGLDDSPKDIYGKSLSIPDELIYSYFEIATDISAAELAEIKSKLDDSQNNPRDIKRSLARKFVEMYHSLDAANNAELEFDKIFINKGIPDDIPEIKVGSSEIEILDLIMLANYAPSRGEARRLVTQGGVSIEGEKISDPKAVIVVIDGNVLKVGKRKFAKLVL
ncbi:MAG: tyrosine--tRNA ligase, partial [Melioribacteraceae bacterium]|nr:tyrosine--tRNA ligase [Melioribacteraceae bacterium]